VHLLIVMLPHASAALLLMLPPAAADSLLRLRLDAATAAAACVHAVEPVTVMLITSPRHTLQLRLVLVLRWARALHSWCPILVRQLSAGAHAIAALANRFANTYVLILVLTLVLQLSAGADPCGAATTGERRV
jgi:hypothetical protein